MRLTPYWVHFAADQSGRPPLGFGLGCGVTAFDEEDAKHLIATEMARLYPQGLPPVNEIVAVERVDDLDQKHVVPNMGNMLKRGVWYPNLSGTYR